MKKFTTFATMTILLLVSLLVLTACNDGVAPLAAPEEGVTFYGDPTDEDYDGYYELSDTDADFTGWDEMSEVPAFGNVTGEVTDIHTNDTGDQVFTIEGEYGTALLMTYFNTFVLGQAPQMGDTITGYFAMDMPMAAIYPPQHMVSVLVNNDDFQDDGISFIHVCRFIGLEGFGDNNQLISQDGQLIINLGGENTEITLQNGEAFDDEIIGRLLLVTYAMNTFSIPPQTTPMQIVVLYERFVTGPEGIDLPEDWDAPEDVAPHYDVVIDGEGLVGALVIFWEEDAIFPTHVELVPVAEHLGTEVNWNQDTNIVTLEGLNGSISFTPGSYDFTVNGETVTLYSQSVDFYGSVYVPILFFRDVFGMPAAYSLEGRIYISSTESDMQ